jgi:2-dehydro-3-deoxyphosphogalactonate aldolase
MTMPEPSASLPVRFLEEVPLVAILRGLVPADAEAIGDALFAAGLRVMEVPLNSPDPFASIALLARRFGDRALVGCGTALNKTDVERTAEAGGQLIVSPHADEAVIARAVQLGMTVLPGFASATEAFRAIDAGARYLKLFPAATYGEGHLKALSAVLPREVKVLAVGGVGSEDLRRWKTAGAFGFGIGGELYKPGASTEATSERARALMAAWHACLSPSPANQDPMP